MVVLLAVEDEPLVLLVDVLVVVVLLVVEDELLVLLVDVLVVVVLLVVEDELLVLLVVLPGHEVRLELDTDLYRFFYIETVGRQRFVSVNQIIRDLGAKIAENRGNTN